MKLNVGFAGFVALAGMAVSASGQVFSSTAVPAGISDNSLTIIVDNKPVLILLGHTNWINSIDCLTMRDGSLLVATGSSDRTVRIWKVALEMGDVRILASTKVLGSLRAIAPILMPR